MKPWKKVVLALVGSFGLLTTCLICGGCGTANDQADRKPRYSEQDVKDLQRLWKVQQSEVHDGPPQQ